LARENEVNEEKNDKKYQIFLPHGFKKTHGKRWIEWIRGIP